MFLFPQAASPAPHDDYWYTDFPVITPNGTYTAPNAAVRYPAVYAAVRIIAETMMSLPLILYRRTNEGKERAENHPLYGLFHGSASEAMTSAEWVDASLWHLLLRGNSYSYRGEGMYPDELMLMHPDRVKPERIGRNRYRYVYTDDDGKQHVYLQSEVLHLRGPTDGGFMGLNPMELHHMTTASSLAQQEFTRRFYENDARPGGWIEYPGNFRNDEDRRNFRESWQKAQRGKNWNKTAVLEHGMKYHSLDMKLSDAQFLESKKYTNHDIARIFRIPPHKLGELDRATHSNIEQQAIEFRQDAILPWARRIEARLSAELLTPRERKRLFFEFLLDGLERGDSAARSKLYHFAITDGWMTRNEARAKENLPPLEGLDEPLTPLNMDRTGADELNDDNETRGMTAHLMRNAAEACVNREAAFVRKVVKTGDAAAIEHFYGETFPAYLKAKLMLENEAIATYIHGSKSARLPDAAENWEQVNLPRLLELVL